MRHARVGKGAPHNPRPGELVRREGRRGTDVRLRIETHPHHGQDPAHRAHQNGIEMLLAQAVVAGMAFDAFIPVDGGALARRIDVDGAHRAHIRAVPAGHAFSMIDSHMLPGGIQVFSGRMRSPRLSRSQSGRNAPSDLSTSSEHITSRAPVAMTGRGLRGLALDETIEYDSGIGREDGR